jgi:eukaryotic-like serine/threonine-protein kinase
MVREKDRAPNSTDAGPKGGDPKPAVETEWARGLVPGGAHPRWRWPESDDDGDSAIPPPNAPQARTAPRAEQLPAAHSPSSRGSDQQAAPSETPATALRPAPPAGPGASGEAAAAPGETALAGQVLGGRYRLVRTLGEGGMGRVYLARDEQVEGETFAIKVLKGGLRGDALALLREEVHKTRRLSHPNIVDVHSLNSDGGRLYVLMEYLEGKPLNVILDEDFGRGMPLSRAWPIIEDVGAALACAHDHSVIHSDLKPANILVTTSGRTKLLDFGIARAARGRGARPDAYALTPAYASCEMLEGQDPDIRDDIYSFGCVIYEMLSGRRPFGKLDALAARDSDAHPQPLAGLSREQNTALSKALSFERESRTGSVEELLAALSSGKSLIRRPALLGSLLAALLLLGFALLALDKLWLSRPAGGAATRASAAPAAVFAPPPHSIAVLPFVNLSGDAQQEYFSDGLTEELLNSLARVNELQVAARTSSFSFKGKNLDIGQIARRLNVAAVLEGSVRRSAHTVRVTAQLINGVTGYHLWSQTYDRNLGDVLQLQTDVANAVASAMRITLLGNTAEKIELGGTRNPAAFDAYLHASKAQTMVHSAADESAPIAGFSEAIRLDPDYALAYAGRAMSRSVYGTSFADRMAVQARQELYDLAQADARKAIALAPDLADGHLALANTMQFGYLDFALAAKEYERAVALAPGNARVLRNYGTFAASMGQAEAGIAAITRSIALDPLNRSGHGALGMAFYRAHQYGNAIGPFLDAISLDPEYPLAYFYRGLAYYGLGNYERARAPCEQKPNSWGSQLCLALAYERLGRHTDADAALAKLTVLEGDNAAVQYAEIYAQWGDNARALEWLEKALQLRDSGLTDLRVDPLLDPLRSEPRFQAVMQALKFPD